MPAKKIYWAGIHILSSKIFSMKLSNESLLVEGIQLELKNSKTNQWFLIIYVNELNEIKF